MKENKELDPEQSDADASKESLPVKVTPKTQMGRPRGAKNKDTLFKELMTGEFQDIAKVNIKKTFEVLFERAHEGDMKAIKLVLDRVVPVTKAVDLADMEKKGLTINISVGDMETANDRAAIIEEAEYTDVTESDIE